jgi:hypothetical protein
MTVLKRTTEFSPLGACRVSLGTRIDAGCVHPPFTRCIHAKENTHSDFDADEIQRGCSEEEFVEDDD